MHWLSIVKRNPFVLPMAVVAGFAMFFISEGSYWQSQDTISDLRGLFSLRQDLVTLERALAGAESEQRSHLLTGRGEFLQPYQDSRRISLEDLTVLDRHPQPAAEASGNPAGLFHGSVHADDGPYARLFRAAALLAQGEYAAALQAGVPGQMGGLLRLLDTSHGLGEAQALLKHQGLPADYVQAVDAGTASRLAGVPIGTLGVLYLLATGSF
jgi:hypothetical protein